MEVPLERQMLETVLDSGQEGILTQHIFERLHLIPKKYVQTLEGLIKKYGLQVRVWPGTCLTGTGAGARTCTTRGSSHPAPLSAPAPGNQELRAGAE